MAGEDDGQERSHEPTQRRLEEAAKKGDVPRSVEVNTLFVLGGLTLVLGVAATSVTVQLAGTMRAFLANADVAPASGAGFRDAGQLALTGTLTALAFPMVVALLAALGGAMVQNRPLWTFEPMAPKADRISPLEGFKRIFGKEALAQFLKGLVKLAIVGALGGAIFWSERDRLEALARNEVSEILPIVQALSLKMLGGMLALFFVVAAADYLYQRFSWLKRNMMTAQELKEEYKETEGSPEVKAKLRQIRMSRVRRRMMQAVPEATVVIMNPTHYAVALKYERGMPAPICVAKGVDSLALRIRALAEENDVPIVESPPLARALHATMDIDDEIPVEHFKAVAEIIGYVLRLRTRGT